MNTIQLPGMKALELAKVDLCVLGGSCTGLFAAVRAARLGVRVALVEKQNSFGGVATQALVTVWHTLMNMRGDKQIIAGLTQECIDRLDAIGAVQYNDNRALTFVMNTEELKIELDRLVAQEKNIQPFLHSFYCAPYTGQDGKLRGAVVATKSGLGVIFADRFIDATGDGDLIRDLPCHSELAKNPQPPTPGMKVYGMDHISENDLVRLIGDHGSEVDLLPDTGWGSGIPGAPGMMYLAPTHVYHVNLTDVNSLTRGEMESRRHVRAVMDLLRKYYPDEQTALVALGAYIGGRESRHVRCLHKLTEEDVLGGGRPDHAIANGTYPCDVHRDDDIGISWKYLDGTEIYRRHGMPDVKRSWLKPGQTPPDYYQVPLETIIPQNLDNVLAAGRMVDTDQSAFGAIRVMVNLNQLGEAAGVAAYDSLDRNVPVYRADGGRVRRLLRDGGSIIL